MIKLNKIRLIILQINFLEIIIQEQKAVYFLNKIYIINFLIQLK